MTGNESIESIYAGALERITEDRSAFLDQACRGNPDLRKQVERLLAANERMEDFLETSPASGDSALAGAAGAETESVESKEDGVGAVLAGKYQLSEGIGEGGMGSVYMAQQLRPVRRVVAVKVIKAGMDTKAVLARFEAERQALAMMEHPNIAHVLDAGTTERGRPFFVMELVKGIPITQYCDERRLTPRQRLELFIPVCHAIQHAHLKGVIHRDIKPSNVLVALYDDHPVPKVIDFGVAKATGQSLTGLTLMTGLGAIVGTPEYMSPEQANLNNLDIDTRSDVYSLGVMLYELLTGTTPVDRKTVGKGALLEILRIVREVEAPKPSVKLSTSDALPNVASARNTEPGKLSNLMKGELDWVLMKALDKDRTRRYETANGFAADIQRYLANEPVIARPPSAAYRFQKTWQRNRFAFVAGIAIAVSLMVVISVIAWQAVQTASMLNELRATAPTFAEQARVLAAHDRFDEALDKLAYASKLRPDVPEYLIARGDLLQCQLRLADAITAYRMALTLRPDDSRAQAGVALCEELLATPIGKDGKLTRETLSKLHVAMQHQQRPAAELLPVARLLGKQRSLIVGHWLERLKGLPVSADRPLTQRMTVREDGLLALDLSGTKITDLTPLAGAPLGVLIAAGCSELTNIDAVRGMQLIELDLAGTGVTNLSPLEKMLSLEKLRLKSAPISDLSPLNGLRLRSLDLTGCPVGDISVLHQSSLEELLLRRTRVADLSPLIGLPLKHVDLGFIPVIDFRPLVGLPLESCNLEGSPFTDLALLRGMPLRQLMLWNCATARNYAVLNEIKSLELLTLPVTYHMLPDHEIAALVALRGHSRLRQLGADSLGDLDHGVTQSKDDFWREWDRVQPLFSGLRNSGFLFLLTRNQQGTYWVRIENQPLSDLSIFKGLPISHLWLNRCKITDLTPIQDLPLRSLALRGNPIADLSPLRKVPLEELAIEHSQISDVSPLVGLPLKRLFLHGCDRLTDIAPLVEISELESLTIPIGAQNVEQLRRLPNLKLLAYGVGANNPHPPVTTVAQFWNEFDKFAGVRALREMGITPNTMQRFEDGTWELNIGRTKIVDLSLLKDAPISELFLWETDVCDLRPLRGMPIKKLGLSHSKVVDLSPLQDKPLDYLNLVGTEVTDISALRGMPLTVLKLNNCKQLTDVSPLKDVKTLRELTLPPNAKDFEFLRNFSRLERLGYAEDASNSYLPDKTAAEFWKELDAKK